MLSYQINSNDCLNITLIITVKHDNFNVSHWQSTWVPTHDHTYTTCNSKIFHYNMFLQQQELQRFFSSTCVSLTKFAFKCSFFYMSPIGFPFSFCSFPQLQQKLVHSFMQLFLIGLFYMQLILSFAWVTLIAQLIIKVACSMHL